MATEIETHPSETGGTTSITQSGRLPVQPVVFLLGNAGLFIRSFAIIYKYERTDERIERLCHRKF